MSAHTPGPWAVWVGEGYDDSIAIAGNPTGALGGMRKLALINLDYRPSRASIDRANADARLMAVAPDLLAALTALVGSIDAEHYDQNTFERAAAEARRVINLSSERSKAS